MTTEPTHSPFTCPHTAACKALALRELAAVPTFIALVEDRTVCNERDADRARRCALRLGLENEEPKQ